MSKFLHDTAADDDPRAISPAKDGRRKDYMIDFHGSMWPDRVSNPVLLTSQSDALPTVLRGPAFSSDEGNNKNFYKSENVSV